MRRAWRWLRGHPWTVGYVILVVLTIASLAIDREQDRREMQEDAYERVDAAEHDARTECRAGNQTRAVIRDIVSKVTTDVSIIDLVPDDRDCVIEALVARRTAAEIEGVEP